ncbi:hypothetical protein OUZ56_017598 [Daphnia magna]|uniref:Uncharacterized protein n=1 Tax=Daphnia magna TaxID=35525 RepID=A0ABR0ATP2_9CRUS|nr:hypothetical protein OUZ56_017598 [Daphnia magna]
MAPHFKPECTLSVQGDWHSGIRFDCDAGDPSSNPECLTALFRAVKTKKKYIRRTSKSDIGLSGGYQKDVLNIRSRHLSDIRRTALCYVGRDLDDSLLVDLRLGQRSVWCLHCTHDDIKNPASSMLTSDPRHPARATYNSKRVSSVLLLHCQLPALARGERGQLGHGSYWTKTLSATYCNV